MSSMVEGPAGAAMVLTLGVELGSEFTQQQRVVRLVLGAPVVKTSGDRQAVRDAAVLSPSPTATSALRMVPS